MDKVEAGLMPICGRCKTRMPVETGPIVVTDATFSDQVERSPLPVLLDLWAPWCGPCRMIAPVIDELGREMGGRVRFAKLIERPSADGKARFSYQRSRAG